MHELPKSSLFSSLRARLKPFLLSALAGIWCAIFAVLNACTQPAAEVVNKYNPNGQDARVVQAVPVVKIQATELPPVSMKAPVSVTPNPAPKPFTSPAPAPRASADPSITEMIATGERLTLGGDSIAGTHKGPTTFIWPVAGKVISGFGPKPGGVRNDGVNIAAEDGAPVHAIADGEVLYLDNVKGYGNLVLLRHSNGWVSTYSHNKAMNVAQGAKVKQGDVIAYVGKTGNVTTPQLHFSLRKEKKPVNPLQYMATALSSAK